MSKWEKVRLGEVCRAESSSIAQKDLESNEGQYPIYGASGLIKCVNFFKQAQPYIAIVKDGAGVGRVSLLPANSSVIGTMQYIIPNEKVVVNYLFFAMKHMNLGKYYSGATIPHIYFKDYKMEDILLPPLTEQQKIAAELDKISGLIAGRKSQIEKLDLLVKAKFVEMFGDETQFNRWECALVEDVADVSVGVVIKPAQYYTNGENGIRAFRSLNVGEMRIKNESWVFFTEEGNKKNSKSILQRGDVLVVRSGAPGTACVVTDDFVGCNAIDIIIVRPNALKVNSEYLCAFTNYPHGKVQIQEGIGGAAQQHFNVGRYKEIKMPLPPLPLQTQFADFVQKTEQTKAAMQKSLAGLETLYRARMQEYFGS